VPFMATTMTAVTTARAGGRLDFVRTALGSAASRHSTGESSSAEILTSQRLTITSASSDTFAGIRHQDCTGLHRGAASYRRRRDRF
jgi:hypothetical protein